MRSWSSLVRKYDIYDEKKLYNNNENQIFNQIIKIEPNFFYSNYLKYPSQNFLKLNLVWVF